MRSHLKTAQSCLALLLVISMSLVSVPVSEASTGQFDERILEAKHVFQEFTKFPEQGIPRDYIRSANALLFFPNHVKGGFLYAGRFGLGIAIVRDSKTGKWSPPAFVRLGGGSFGLQAGVQWADLILIGKGHETLPNIINDRFTLGGSLSGAVGPWGRHMEFNTDWVPSSSLFAYSNSRGLFASVAMDGMVLSFDDDHNQMYYGEGVTGWDVLYGDRAKYSPAAQQLIDSILEYLGEGRPVQQIRPTTPPPAPAPRQQPVPTPRIVDPVDQSILLVTNITRSIKVYYDYNSASIRPDAEPILRDAAQNLKKYPDRSIIITGHTDIRGSKSYNSKLGLRRAESIRRFMLNQGIPESRIKVVSRGEIDAVAPPSDLMGMQKDRFSHFVIGELVKTNLTHRPTPALNAKMIGENTYVTQKSEDIESRTKVSTKEYTVKRGDTLSKIAKAHLGSSHRWKYLYELNAKHINNPNRLLMGQKIAIPVE